MPTKECETHRKSMRIKQKPKFMVSKNKIREVECAEYGKQTVTQKVVLADSISGSDKLNNLLCF